MYVIVCRFNKLVHLIPCHFNITARCFPSIFSKHFCRHHRLPMHIVSDRIPQFAAHFWRQMCSDLGIYLQLTLAQQPSTDSHIERTNSPCNHMSTHHTTIGMSGLSVWSLHIINTQLLHKGCHHFPLYMTLTPFSSLDVASVRGLPLRGTSNSIKPIVSTLESIAGSTINGPNPSQERVQMILSENQDFVVIALNEVLNLERWYWCRCELCRVSGSVVDGLNQSLSLSKPPRALPPAGSLSVWRGTSELGRVRTSTWWSKAIPTAWTSLARPAI